MLKPQRLGIYTFFNKENLIDKVDLSLLGYKNFNQQNKGIFHNILDTKLHDEWYNIASESIKNKISLKSEFENRVIGNKTSKQTYSTALHEIAMNQNLYKHGYINIVTESQYEWKNTIHITEKSILPFFFHQIPIIVAPHGHVQSMKDMWNLDFFDDIVNHTYDSIENPILRFRGITEEILRLSKMENEIMDFFKNNQYRFEENKKIIKNIQYSNENKNFWRSLTYIE